KTTAGWCPPRGTREGRGRGPPAGRRPRVEAGRAAARSQGQARPLYLPRSVARMGWPSGWSRQARWGWGTGNALRLPLPLPRLQGFLRRGGGSMELVYGSPQGEELTLMSLDPLRERIFDEGADYSSEGQGAAYLGLKDSYAKELGCGDESAVSAGL